MAGDGRIFVEYQGLTGKTAIHNAYAIHAHRVWRQKHSGFGVKCFCLSAVGPSLCAPARTQAEGAGRAPARGAPEVRLRRDRAGAFGTLVPRAGGGRMWLASSASRRHWSDSPRAGGRPASYAITAASEGAGAGWPPEDHCREGPDRALRRRSWRSVRKIAKHGIQPTLSSSRTSAVCAFTPVLS